MQKNSVNKVILVGRMGQDPELKYTPTQTAVVNITVATTDKYQDKETTEWSRVVAFGKSAEFIANYLKKGALIYIDGRLQTRQWENRDGVKMYTTEVIANTITPLGASNQNNASTPSQAQPTPQMGDDQEPDLPF